MKVRINPSVLSADFGNFESEFMTIAEADCIHVDVMDNHFVPNLTFGLPVVKRMQEFTPKPLDVHLMIDDVNSWAVKYAELGVFSVTFHLEASADPIKLAREIRKTGSRAGIAIKPGTSLDSILEDLHEFDQLLVMTVEPGFGGQALIDSTLPKITMARNEISKRNLDTWLQVDGGIDETNIAAVAAYGADTFVAGSAVFKVADRSEQIKKLRNLAESGSELR